MQQRPLLAAAPLAGQPQRSERSDGVRLPAQGR
jgi:hypothetical protein